MTEFNITGKLMRQSALLFKLRLNINSIINLQTDDYNQST